MNENVKKWVFGLVLGLSLFLHALPAPKHKTIESAEPYIHAAARIVREIEAGKNPSNDDEAVFRGVPKIARILRVYDGDTIYCNLEGWPAVVGDNIGIRFHGVDCPEIRGSSDYEKAAALFVRDKLAELLQQAENVTLRNVERGKYFRLLANVDADDICVSSWLLENKYAKPYSGGSRQEWTNEELELIRSN